MLPFTLVSTVYNEMRRLPHTIADLEAQDRMPTEIVVVDAGSSDGTFEYLQEWARKSRAKVVVLQEKGCSIARGRNMAIETASHDLIASTDFGCRFAPSWLANLMAPFDADPNLQLTGGSFCIPKAEVRTPASRADYILQNGYKVVQDQFFSVSSRSIAYKRSVWAQLGGYLEWLTMAADDTIFWRMAKRAGIRHLFVTQPDVLWLRHTTMQAFAREAYRYGLGDGESGINFRSFLSSVLEFALRQSLFLSIVFSWLWWTSDARPVVIIALILLLPFASRSYRRAYKNFKGLQKTDTDFKFTYTDLGKAIILTERSRLQYFHGYFKGWLFSNDKVKLGRKALPPLPV
jgi:glycosyltransferase involved in cell wall biosynthesis